MSTETLEETMGTRPEHQHEWLRNLIGEWRTESEMIMPDGSRQTAHGRETIESLGGLWALGKGSVKIADAQMDYITGLGWDVSFKEYRGFKIMSASSHLWKSTGTLSEDDRTMTLDCVGPNMEIEGETANYRDVIRIVDANHLTLTSSGQDAEGTWHEYMTAHYTRE
ncbi:MAG TPA: DUF1579 domain-containing protein [Fimbriimonadaceae bacterium]|nr:DUF1579 domain-containing protein [Fimbriimonadaceae bacterium]